LLSSEFFLVDFFVVFIVFSKTAAFCMITFSLVHFFKNVFEIDKYSSERKFFMLDRRSSSLTFFLQVQFELIFCCVTVFIAFSFDL